MKYYSVILLGILALLSAAFVGWNRLVFTPWLASDSLYTLNNLYGPNHDPQFGYNSLYDYARHITEHRNSQALFYQSIICLLCIVLGIISVLWSRDVKNQGGNSH